MPTPDPEAFWTLVARSGLVDQGSLASLRQAHAAAATGGGTKGIAQWLVNRGTLTAWQAKRLAGGDLGPFLLGDYRLLDRHECEGEGLLFTARHEPSGRTVTLFLLHPKLCKRLDVWTGIVRRMTSAHQAVDPMLSRTWALQQAEGRRFIVCEPVRGEPLAAELERLGPLPPHEAAALAGRIARAVGDLHARDAVHAGLSLDSLLREPPAPGAADRTGRVRLLQFPLVGDPHRTPPRPPVADDQEIARLGRRASFIAPELMMLDAGCDPRSDVYALGCILHALLTGVPPCWQGEPQATLRQASTVGPARLGPPAVPADLAAIVASMTAHDPEIRYPTAGDAADALAAFCGIPLVNEPPAPEPPVEPVTRAPAPREPIPPEPEPDDDESLPILVLRDAASPEPAPAGFDPRGGKRSGPISPAAAARRRLPRRWWIGAGLAAGLLAVVAAWASGWLGGGSRSGRERAAAKHEVAAPMPAAAEPAVPPATAVAPVPQPDARQMIVNDPDLPWASPTSGLPPTLAYLPPGSQLVLLARPREILEQEEGPLFIRSLGPVAEAAIEAVATACGCSPVDLETVQAGWQTVGIDEVIGGYAARLVAARSLPADDAARKAAWGDTVAEEIDGETIHAQTTAAEGSGGPLGFWVPRAEGGRVLVAAPVNLLREMIEAQPPTGDAAADEALAATLPMDLEHLVGMLDRSRHLTLFGAPHYLLHGGRGMLTGPLATLVDPLGLFFGGAVPAAALSLHFGDRVYAELDAIATAETPAVKLAPRLARAIGAWPEAVERFCGSLDPDPYGRALVQRLPAMIRALAANLRSGAEGKGAVINAYLPPHAAHNIALAAELALAQSPAAEAAAPVPPAAAPPRDALGRLQTRITLTFAKDTLEKSIQMIAEEIGVPMEILGPDLQLEGITKNQSFALDERDKTAAEILRAILAKANPEGKLVFVVRRRDGVESIEITTRAAAAKRGDSLPPGF